MRYWHLCFPSLFMSPRCTHSLPLPFFSSIYWSNLVPVFFNQSFTNCLNFFMSPSTGTMSAAAPMLCADVVDPPTALFNWKPRKPDVTFNGLPHASRSGSSSSSIRRRRLYSCFASGTLLRPFLCAVYDLHNSLILKYFIIL